MSKTRKSIATIIVALLLAGILAVYAVSVFVYKQPFGNHLALWCCHR